MNKKWSYILISLIILDILLLKFLPWFFEGKRIMGYSTWGIILSMGIILFLFLIVIQIIYTIKMFRNKRYDKLRIITLVLGWLILFGLSFSDNYKNCIEPFKSKIIYKGNSVKLSLVSFEIILRENFKFEYRNNSINLKKYTGTFKVENDTIFLTFNESVLNSGDFLVYKSQGFAMPLKNKYPKSEFLPDTIYFNGGNKDLLRFIKE
ncbi:hypothetical protein ACFLSE_09165 [Bacteroidota bacterium]